MSPRGAVEDLLGRVRSLLESLREALLQFPDGIRHGENVDVVAIGQSNAVHIPQHLVGELAILDRAVAQHEVTTALGD